MLRCIAMKFRPLPQPRWALVFPAVSFFILYAVGILTAAIRTVALISEVNGQKPVWMSQLNG